jgi:hypothetical protein
LHFDRKTTMSCANKMALLTKMNHIISTVCHVSTEVDTVTISQVFFITAGQRDRVYYKSYAHFYEAGGHFPNQKIAARIFSCFRLSCDEHHLTTPTSNLPPEEAIALMQRNLGFSHILQRERTVPPILD